MITSTKVAFSLQNFFIPNSDKSEIFYKVRYGRKIFKWNFPFEVTETSSIPSKTILLEEGKIADKA